MEILEGVYGKAEPYRTESGKAARPNSHFYPATYHPRRETKPPPGGSQRLLVTDSGLICGSSLRNLGVLCDSAVNAAEKYSPPSNCVVSQEDCAES